MPKQIIKVPPSTTEVSVEIEIPDVVTQLVTVDIPDSYSVKISGVTDPVPPTPDPNPEPEPNPNPPPVPTPGYAVSYENDFNDATDINANQLGRGIIVKLGDRTVFKAEVKVGDKDISKGFRSEQQYTGAAQNPLEGAIEYDCLFESWEQPGWGGSSVQWHPQGSGSAFLFLETAQKFFSVYQFKKGYSPSLGSITPNKWYRIRWEFKWSTGADGYARLFIDGKQIWSYTGATYSGSQPYLKVGLNFFSGSADQTKSVHGGVVYYDNLVVFKKS
jgi:hypothetical protein